MANPSVVVEFLADTAKLVSGVKDVQSAGEDASKGLGKVNWKSVAKWTAVAGGVAATGKLLKDSASGVVELAKATAGLQRSTDLDAKTASAWVEVLKVRGIEIGSFQTSLTKTSKLMEKYRLAEEEATARAKDYDEASKRLWPTIQKGGDAGKEATKELNKWGDAADAAAKKAGTAAKPFEQLGINLATVKKGDVQGTLLQAADGLAKLKNPAERAALVTQLFGRQGLKLLPVLLKGKAGIKELLGQAEKYGATIDGKTVKSVSKLADMQRKLHLAQDGVKNSIGKELLPIQLSLYGALLDVVNTLIPLVKQYGLLKPLLIAVGIAMGAYKAAVISTTLAESKLFVTLVKSVAGWVASTAATIAETIAKWANVTATFALIAAYALIVIGIAAVIAIGILLYKNWDKISKMAGTVWGAIKKGAQVALAWLKQNWPYIVGILAGPFGLAVAAIYKNWDKITGAIRDGFDAVKQAINAGKAAVVAWGSNVAAWIKQGIVGTLTGIGGAAWNVVNNVGAVITQYAGKIKGWGTTIADGIKSGFKSSIEGLAAIFKGALNAVITLWNKLKIPGFKIKGPGPLPDIKFPAFKFPNIATLAQGGLVTKPTLAVVGERGPEAVVPLSGGAASSAPIEVRVFIGETELRGMVRSEVRTENTRTARVLLGGLA